MEKVRKTSLICAIILFVVFLAFTAAVKLVDVQPIGPEGTAVGFASVNGAFRDFIGSNMLFFRFSDLMGYLALLIVACFGVFGAFQLFTRRSLLEVDRDIVYLGIFYIIVGICYLFFSKVTVNYRPIIDAAEGLEASYPSSHTVLAISVIVTAIMQAYWRIGHVIVRRGVIFTLIILADLILSARVVSGAHWLTDIIGGLILSASLCSFYYYFAKCALENALQAIEAEEANAPDKRGGENGDL